MSKITELIERQISGLAEADRKEKARRDDDRKRLEVLKVINQLREGEAFPKISFRINYSELSKGSRTYRMVLVQDMMENGRSPIENDIYWENPSGVGY